MESSNMGDVSVPFMQQLLRNNILLLTVSLAVGGTIYFVVGLYMLIAH